MQKNKIVLFLYNFLLSISLLFLLPKMVWKRKLGSLLRRCSVRPPALHKRGRVVWIHAVSLGEVKAISALVERLQRELSPQFVISSITETGYSEAMRLFPSAHHLYLPIDLPFFLKRLVKQASPDLLVISESDFWYNFLLQAKQSGAKLLVVNAKLSERSMRCFRRVPWFSKSLFGLFDHICAQSAEHRSRFEAIGVEPARLSVTGNLKFASTSVAISPAPLDPIITAGSTHDPEEKMLIRLFTQLKREYPRLQFFLAPRHPERCKEVAHLLSREGVAFCRYSENPSPNSSFVLVDTIGALKELYKNSSVAIVCGSFTERVGGHNILEPCFYGVPTLFGPYMYSQRELEALVLSHGAGLQVREENLFTALKSVMSSPQKREEMARAARSMIETHRSSLDRTFKRIEEILKR